jgi:hypothetical protein
LAAIDFAWKRQKSKHLIRDASLALARPPTAGAISRQQKMQHWEDLDTLDRHLVVLD